MVLQRRSIRLREYDYSQPGAYYVTLATWTHEVIFGEIPRDQMLINRFGQVAEGEMRKIPQRFSLVKLDEFIIMPNHVHAIIWILPPDSVVGARQEEPKESSNPPVASPGLPSQPIPFSPTYPSDSVVEARGEKPDESSNLRIVSPGLPTDPDNGSVIIPVGRRGARLTGSGSNSLNHLASPLQGPAAGSLGVIIGAYKSTTARIINGMRRTPGKPVWQRNYFEHVIRNDKDLDRIRRYIQANPLHWQTGKDIEDF